MNLREWLAAELPGGVVVRGIRKFNGEWFAWLDREMWMEPTWIDIPQAVQVTEADVEALEKVAGLPSLVERKALTDIPPGALADLLRALRSGRVACLGYLYCSWCPLPGLYPVIPGSRVKAPYCAGGLGGVVDAFDPEWAAEDRRAAARALMGTIERMLGPQANYWRRAVLGPERKNEGLKA